MTSKVFRPWPALLLLGVLLPTEVTAQLSFSYSIPDQEFVFDSTTGDGEFEAPIVLSEDPTGVGFPNPTEAFLMSIAFDPAILEFQDVGIGPVLLTLNGGSGPDFFAVATADSDDGFAYTAVYSFIGTEELPFPRPAEVGFAQFSTNAANLSGAGVIETELDFSDDLLYMASPLPNQMVVNGESHFPELENGLITLIPGGVPFRRGDADGSGSVNGLVDGLFILNFQFVSGSPAPDCLDAADVDDNGQFSGIVDGFFLLNYWFIPGTPGPPPPGPGCGDDPTLDGLDLCVYPPC